LYGCFHSGRCLATTAYVTIRISHDSQNKQRFVPSTAVNYSVIEAQLFRELGREYVNRGIYINVRIHFAKRKKDETYGVMISKHL
jgi:hypothetical protein